MPVFALTIYVIMLNLVGSAAILCTCDTFDEWWSSGGRWPLAIYIETRNAALRFWLLFAVLIALPFLLPFLPNP